MNRKPIAEEYLLLTEEWKAAAKETIVDNLMKILCEHFPNCQSFNDRQKLISELTYSNKHTVYAWTNLSRGNVKMPLLKLCLIAKELNEEVENFFNQNNKE